MRVVLLTLGTLVLALIGAGAASVTGHEPEADPGGISNAMLSRCAGIAGLELRSADAAFGELMLDGAPWLTAQHDDQALVVTSTGRLRRRNGTTVPFRFVCVLDDKGHGSMLRITSVGIDGTLPPSRSIKGMAAPAGLKTSLPRGAELRVQLLDIATDPKGKVLGEQVIRSGWAVPIPFDLRVPADAIREDSKLAITARIVLARAEVYRMASPRTFTVEELRRPVTLDLSP
jgi:hypothetical protein